MEKLFLKELLGWSLLINFGILLWWVIMLKIAHDWIYSMHRWWGFKNLSAEKFDEIQYSGMAFYKLLIFVFNVVPYLAMVIIA